MPGGIAEWDPSIPIGLAADAGRVEAAVAALARRGIAALLWPLLRTEAIASSRIEDLRVGHERLARARRQITVATILDLQGALLAGTRDAAIAGRLRDAQTGSADGTRTRAGRRSCRRGRARSPGCWTTCAGSASATICRRRCRRRSPTSSSRPSTVRGRQRPGGPRARPRPLYRGGLIADGRGDPVPPPLSLAFAADPEGYVAGLTAFRSGDHRRWLELFLSALHRAVEVAEGLAADVAGLQERWRARAGRPRRGSAAEAIIARLPEQPVLDLRRATALSGASGEATRRAIDRLARAGVLREFTGGRRDRRWQAIGLLELLDRLEDSRRGLRG